VSKHVTVTQKTPKRGQLTLSLQKRKKEKKKKEKKEPTMNVFILKKLNGDETNPAVNVSALKKVSVCQSHVFQEDQNKVESIISAHMPTGVI